MSNFQKFFVPIDGSDASLRAVAKAAELAAITDATIYMIYVATLKTGLRQHVVDTNEIPPDVIETLKQEGTKVLESAFKDLPPQRKEKTIMCCETGMPKKIILAKEEEFAPDLIIMGTRGLNAAQSVLIGSLSQYMVEHASCPVLIVK